MCGCTWENLEIPGSLLRAPRNDEGLCRRRAPKNIRRGRGPLCRRGAGDARWRRLNSMTMAHDSTDQAKASGRRKAAAGSQPAGPQPDLPPQESPQDPLQDRPQDLAAGDIDPATVNAEEEDEARLPET